MEHNDTPRSVGSILGNKKKLFGEGGSLPTIFEVRVESLRPNPYQPRTEFDEESLAELAESIKGVLAQRPIRYIPRFRVF